MSYDFSAANIELWDAVLQFCIIAAIMLLANVLRRKIPFIRKSLMPTAVLGGFLALGLRYAGLPLNIGFMENITYHTIGLGFIALSLQRPAGKEERRKDLAGIKSGALIASSYVIQGILGLIITIGLAMTVMPGLFPAAGLLLPMGYGQGPGQANNVGGTYEAMGFAGGQSFGLSIAAAGFICACVGGVIYLNILKKKGKIDPERFSTAAQGASVSDFQDSGEIPISESIDRFSIQVGLVLLIYLLTYLFSFGVTSALTAWAPGIAKMLNSVIWGFNFIIGSVIAIAFRGLFNGLKKAKVMTQQYQNNYLLSRISGCAFDIMVIAGIASIDIAVLKDLLLPFLIMAVTGGVLTFFYLQWICKKIYPGYYYEGFLSMYGMMTGTISSGVLLLRELDPSYVTPASNNLIVGSSFAIIFGAPLLLLISWAPQSQTALFATLGILIVYMVGLTLFMIKVKRKPKKEEPKEE